MWDGGIGEERRGRKRTGRGMKGDSRRSAALLDPGDCSQVRSAPENQPLRMENFVALLIEGRNCTL